MRNSSKYRQQIQAIWEQLENTLQQAWETETLKSAEFSCLRDYVPNISWHDKLRNLLDREIEHERRHRSGAPSDYHSILSHKSAAQLIICQRIAEGSHLHDMPLATTFIMWRDTAAEAMLLGYLLRGYVSQAFRHAAQQLDYSKIMQEAQKQSA